MCINRTKHIIKEIYVTVLINCSGELNTLFLSTAEINSSLPYFSLIPKLHPFEIFFQAARPYDFSVSFRIHRQSKQNAVLNRPILNPSSLCDICSAPTYPDLYKMQRWLSKYLAIYLYQL
jgi:hypothetical protein